MRETLILSLLGASVAQGAVFPGADWETRSPESQGMSSVGLEEGAAYALKAGGGSGCVIRHGYLVKEWGPRDRLADTKSNAKGTLGATLLGIALDAGMLKLEDAAQEHYPQIGAEKPENIATGWLGEITVRQLATMTAGFDDGRPPRLVYRPGTDKGIYSNDTSNMLAELLTLLFGEDVYPVFKRKVMDPIGVPPKEWNWRQNAYRAKTIKGLTSREFASGLTITHRSLARVGHLYLRDGNWNGRQIVSREFIRLATTPTDLPAPWPYYAFYWGSNERGTYEDIPKDTYWALGLGDSFVLFCRSLDLVVVRLGTGSKVSQLPESAKDDWGGRVEGFFRLIVNSVQDHASAPSGEAVRTLSALPPRSPVIQSIEWAPADSVMRLAKGSDNWPMTWGDDDALYTAYGDGNGFAPFVPTKLSLGFAKVIGNPPDIRGVNIRSKTGEALGDGARGRKASGLLMVDGVLYALVRNAGNAQLGWSADRGVTWTWADWRFTESFGCPTFLNFGKNYAGARDDFVYIFSPDSDSAYERADRFVLARVKKGQLRTRSAYEFFRALDASGQPQWTQSVRERGAVFTSPGNCYRSGISYDAGLKRYLWCQTGLGEDTRFRGGLAIHDAPEPWGPWTTVFQTDDWDIGPGESSSFPTKWMSADGRTLHLVCSGNDSFTVRKATLVVVEDSNPPITTDGPLRISVANPRYFADASDKVVFLAGAHDGWELQDFAWGDSVREKPFAWERFLDFLTDHHHNVIRLWCVEHTKTVDADADLTSPMVYERVAGHGWARDGSDKFDLDRLNPAYFDRLRARTVQARERGIYVIVMLFQGWSIEDKGGKVNPWPHHPFHPDNNVNGVNADLNGDGQGRELHEWQGADHLLTQRQRAYVRRVVDTVSDLDNVLYEIANESHPISLEWQNQMARFIRDCEKTRGMRHPVGITVPFGTPVRKGLNAELFRSEADWISPNGDAPGGFNFRDNPPPADGRKVVLSDSDHLHGNQLQDPRWVWRTFCRGHNVLFMDRWTEAPDDPLRQQVRKAVGQVRQLADRINLGAMKPFPELTSTRFCLADPGREFLVYQPAEQPFTVELKGDGPRYAVEWFNPRESRSSKAEPVEGGGRRQFAAPFGGDSVLHLKALPAEPGREPHAQPKPPVAGRAGKTPTQSSP